MQRQERTDRQRKGSPIDNFQFPYLFSKSHSFSIGRKDIYAYHNIIQFKIKCIYDGCMFAVISIIQLKISMGRGARGNFNFTLTEQDAVSRLRRASPHLLCSFVAHLHLCPLSLWPHSSQIYPSRIQSSPCHQKWDSRTQTGAKAAFWKKPNGRERGSDSTWHLEPNGSPFKKSGKTLKQKDPFPESSVKGVDGIHLKIKISFGGDLTTSSKRG